VSGRAERWRNLWSRIGGQGSGAEVLAKLETAYGMAGRHYHTLGHVDRMVEEFHALGPVAHQPEAVELALWLHDVVWSPEATDAEAASAAWAHAHLAPRGVSPALLDRVADLILATRHLPAPPATRDEALVRDLDLLTFAAPPGIFDRCNDLVRREYAHVPDEAWRTGRARVLRGFLERPVLYFTPALAALEPAARANLGRAVATLDIPYTYPS
jgi:predicted metal-dependent HD superfamily phosphohydrolase